MPNDGDYAITDDGLYLIDPDGSFKIGSASNDCCTFCGGCVLCGGCPVNSNIITVSGLSFTVNVGTYAGQTYNADFSVTHPNGGCGAPGVWGWIPPSCGGSDPPWGTGLDAGAWVTLAFYCSENPPVDGGPIPWTGPTYHFTVTLGTCVGAFTVVKYARPADTTCATGAYSIYGGFSGFAAPTLVTAGTCTVTLP